MHSLEQYRDLIARVEQQAAADPRRYKVRLALLAALGLVYVIGMALLALVGTALVFGLVVVSKQVLLLELAWLPLCLSFLLLRALWVRLPPPQGRRVTHGEAPRLFEEIEHVRKALAAKPIHEVMLTPEFNASVSQVPRLGLLGWPKRYLVIGLPMLSSLPPYQFRAVLAHEFGHLSANHARFGNWIYRVRSMWSRSLKALQAKGSFANRLLARFFEWYAPYFNAYSFVLARANEYEADRDSARVTSTEDAGDALASVYSRGEYLDSMFWPGYYRRAEDQPHPPAQPFSEYIAGLRTVSDAASQTALGAALARQTGIDDTHPSLADRLKALEATPRVPACFQLTAAHALLGDLRVELMAEFDRAWQESMEQPWGERHAFLQEMKRKLTSYETTAQARELNQDEHWDYARAVEELRGGPAAMPVLDTLLQRFPHHAPAYYARGRIRLDERDERGAADIEQAMALDEEAKAPGAQLLFSWFYARQEFARCDHYRQTLEQAAEERQGAAMERLTVTRNDVFEPHGLGGQELTPWVEALSAERSVKRAWLARKRVSRMSKTPAYVLIVEFRRFALQADQARARLQESVPAWCCPVLRAGHSVAHRRIRQLAGALVYLDGRRGQTGDSK